MGPARASLTWSIHGHRGHRGPAHLPFPARHGRLVNERSNRARMRYESFVKGAITCSRALGSDHLNFTARGRTAGPPGCLAGWLAGFGRRRYSTRCYTRFVPHEDPLCEDRYHTDQLVRILTPSRARPDTL